jgi:transcriptional regulator with XRE-family HTH domain
MSNIFLAVLQFVANKNRKVNTMEEQSYSEAYNRLFIGENLRKLRCANQLSTTEVGKVIGKSRQGYANYENGSREISIKDLLILSGFYNVSIDIIVANPYSTKNDQTVSFRSFAKSDVIIKEVAPLYISTIYDDVICYKKSDTELEFFWKTNVHVENFTMLFSYYDTIYVSKVFHNKNKGGGHFYDNEGMPVYFTQSQQSNIFYKGVMMAHLNKEYAIDNFLK